jgi:hypothetical protein
MEIVELASTTKGMTLQVSKQFFHTYWSLSFFKELQPHKWHYGVKIVYYCLDMYFNGLVMY